MSKSSVQQIKDRFDADVDRFSSLESGHTAIMDSVVMLEVLTKSAAACTPNAESMLDIGCGAGNYSLKLLGLLPKLKVSLVDLSLPMLERARERLSKAGCHSVEILQSDIRDLNFGKGQFDIILAGAVFHHLRGDEEWREVFNQCYQALKPGGGLWIADLIEHENSAVQKVMWERYSQYLIQAGGEDLRDKVFANIEQEDTPRGLNFQLALMREIGFCEIEVLHKSGSFAAFGGMRK